MVVAVALQVALVEAVAVVLADLAQEQEQPAEQTQLAVVVDQATTQAHPAVAQLVAVQSFTFDGEAKPWHTLHN